MQSNESVAAQYEKWVYPLPVADLKDPKVANERDIGDPFLMQNAYWPKTGYREGMKILIAGCGSNAAARYALHHPKASVVGIDLSRSSLDHEEILKKKHSLSNLELHQHRIEDIEKLGMKFDMIDVSGVLHHLPSPESGLKALAKVLEPEGVIFLMLYGKYGRTGVYIMQELFRRLKMDQSEKSVEIMKDVLGNLKPDHPLAPYYKLSPDSQYDAGLVDSFLHPIDRAFTVEDCLNLVKSSGLQFQGWVDNAFYFSEWQTAFDRILKTNFPSLTDEEIWKATELFNANLPKHCFYICRADRDPKNYRIHFENEEFLNFIPLRRGLEVLEDTQSKKIQITNQRVVVTLEGMSANVFDAIDEKKTVRECLELASLAPAEKTALGRALFRGLWRVGLLHFKLP